MTLTDEDRAAVLEMAAKRVAEEILAKTDPGRLYGVTIAEASRRSG